MLDACVAEAGIDTKQERFPKGDVLADIYSLAVNTDRSIDAASVLAYDFDMSFVSGIFTKSGSPR